MNSAEHHQRKLLRIGAEQHQQIRTKTVMNKKQYANEQYDV
jgi:hypothetical protein